MTQSSVRDGRETAVKVNDDARAIVIVFTLAAFLGSTLLFLIQPLAARLLLPLVGGSSSLWNTAMVFFQLALLAGYGFAHMSLARTGVRRHPFVQAIVLFVPIAVLPLAVPDGWDLPAGARPALWVLATLAVMVGLPFFALATTSPTLQMWFSATDHHRADDPYFLYAAGNVGSVVALVGYPLFLEPVFSLRTQSRIWAVLYVCFVLACLAAALLGRSNPATNPLALDTANHETITWPRRLTWLSWSFIPSLLMLGVTMHIATDIASFPLLWVLPLLLYMLTFIIAFASDSDRRLRRTTSLVWFAALPLGLVTFLQGRFGPVVLVVHLVWFFLAALLCHSKLAHDRPTTGRLTEYYLVLSIGGALGGVFASLLAPVIFSTVLEYPVAVALVLIVARRPEKMVSSDRVTTLATVGLTLALLGAVVIPTQFLAIMAIAAVMAFLARGPAGVIILICASLVGGPSLIHGGTDILRDRSFFGVYTVLEINGVRQLMSGTTVHGSQLLSEPTDPTPTTYYHRSGPIGQVLATVESGDVGVVGLGAGSLADYSMPGDKYVFFEIDQLVVEIAADPELFNYLSDAEGDVEVIVADGRRGLADWDGDFDVVVIDAFSSDAIPVHLLTAEAMELYLDRVSAGGTIMIHISNRHFDLRPVLGRLAEHHGATAYVQRFAPNADDVATGATPSSWVAIAPADTQPVWIDDPRFVRVQPGGPLWTDDYSNVLGALEF